MEGALDEIIDALMVMVARNVEKICFYVFIKQ